ncbi:MAG TPA: DUF1501 domain-containing protein, partial [Planctomycetaceae bacterium]|nr:DUF1501 domain-containing protein [Planctomycetaceae bacterium]
MTHQSRRHFLEGTLSAGTAGLGMPELLRLQAASGKQPPSDTAVIQIWLGGGHSQF